MIVGVVDEAGEPLAYANGLLTETGQGAASDADGVLKLDGVPFGAYTLRVSAVGYATLEERIRIDATSPPLRLTLTSGATLEAATVSAKSAATELREQAYAVEVVQAKRFRNLSANANDLLRNVSGVNIRESGGLGSSFTLSLNGLSGNQVRTFLDGVPMDYFGSSLTLNNFSANLIDRIEVYKGVVPVHLSSDALGGAINVVTTNQQNSYVDASVSAGSYGTRIASLNAQYRHQRTGFAVRLKSFYNTSDNDYRVPINLVDFTTGKPAPEVSHVRRFHDAYTSRMGWVEAGILGKPYADRLLVGVLYSDNYDEVQQPANAIGQAKIPYGKVAQEEDKTIVNFTYAKSGLLNDRLSVASYIVGVRADNRSVDTSSRRYNWSGASEPRNDVTTGEIENRKTLLSLRTDNLLANLNGEFQFDARHSIAANYSLNALELSGDDPFKGQNNTQFGEPSRIRKQVLGLNYTVALLARKLKLTAFGKGYDYRIESQTTDYGGDERLPFANEQRNLGLGASATYHFERLQLKASFENATRFPEIIELFGDGLNVLPSPLLKPERSRNYNVGFIYKPELPQNLLTLSVNGFVRQATDFIIPRVRGIVAYHENKGNVLSRGADLAASFAPGEHLVVTLNGTYLDLRDNDRYRDGTSGQESALYRQRLPNVPYLFGNLNVAYRYPDLLAAGDNASVTLTQGYVHEFFYRWANLASSNKSDVPRQLTTNLDLVYSFKNERYNASVGVANLWDAEVYDNFQQLRPGRTYSAKLRLFLN